MFKCSAKELGTWLYFSAARQMGHSANIEEKNFWAPIKRLLARFLKAGNIRPIKASSSMRMVSGELDFAQIVPIKVKYLCLLLQEVRRN